MLFEIVQFPYHSCLWIAVEKIYLLANLMSVRLSNLFSTYLLIVDKRPYFLDYPFYFPYIFLFNLLANFNFDNSCGYKYSYHITEYPVKTYINCSVYICVHQVFFFFYFFFFNQVFYWLRT